MQDTKIAHTAVHEAGHSLVAFALRQNPVLCTIAPETNKRGKVKTLGHAQHRYAERPYWQKGQVSACISMAGFWAELIVFGYCNGGHSVDMKHASRITHSHIQTLWPGSRTHKYEFLYYSEIVTRRGYPNSTALGKPDHPTGGDKKSAVPVVNAYKAWREAWAKCEEILFREKIALECLAESLLVTQNLEGKDLILALEFAVNGLVLDLQRKPGENLYTIAPLDKYRAEIAAKANEEV